MYPDRVMPKSGAKGGTHLYFANKEQKDKATEEQKSSERRDDENS